MEHGPDHNPEWVEKLQTALLGWSESPSRDLPWRGERDAYRVLVSEMMLVQTTVAAVLPYFERFTSRFPTVAHLAQADEAEVLKAWEGLGYYRRARQLHAAAREIVELHGGIVPQNSDALLRLPGIGRYIAGAILSFAFDQPAAIVEANSQRVLARLIGWEGEIPATGTRLWNASERLVPAQNPGRFNQALIDLGASVCIPKQPLCLICPASSICRARELGIESRLPNLKPRTRPTPGSEACAIVLSAIEGGSVLIVKRGRAGLWEGFWEFPTAHLEGADPAKRAIDSQPGETLEQSVKRLTGAAIEIGPKVQSIRYSVTRYRMELKAYLAHPRFEGVELRPGLGLEQAIWEKPNRLGDYPFSSPTRRLAQWLARQDPEALSKLSHGSASE